MPAEKKPADPVEPCPLEEEKKSTITGRWSKSSVTTDRNSSFPPASPPTDVVPEAAKVSPIVETTDVPDGTPAKIEVRHCHTGAQVKNGVLSKLEVKGNKVVDPKTGNPPEWTFDASHQPWDPWDKPFYYFKAIVDHEGLQYETPKDYKKKAAQCLRATYSHQCVAESSTLGGVLPECNQVSGILNGVEHSQSAVQNLTTPNIPLTNFGSLIRNTYVFHVASHGNVRNRATGAAISLTNDPPDDVTPASAWRSVVSITAGSFGDSKITQVASVPSVPRYLWYASTCLTGWEPSFANTMIGRGTRNVLAFRRTIPDAEAPQLARKFYGRWANKYKLDPEKIPDCFFKTAGDHYDNMRPVLFGAGGGQIKGGGGLSGGEIAAIAIGAVVAGALIGVAIWALLKN